MSLTKKQIFVTGAIGFVSISLAVLYYNYKKLMAYEIKPKGIKLKSLSPVKIDLQVLLDFVNPSALNFDIVEQSYKVFVGGVYVGTFDSDQVQEIAKKSTSKVVLNVKIVPDKAKETASNVLKAFVTKTENTELKIEINLKLRVGIFPITIPYIYTIPLKDLLKEK